MFFDGESFSAAGFAVLLDGAVYAFFPERLVVVYVGGNEIFLAAEQSYGKEGHGNGHQNYYSQN